jgi:hypothetical protein
MKPPILQLVLGSSSLAKANSSHAGGLGLYNTLINVPEIDFVVVIGYTGLQQDGIFGNAFTTLA